ncbi:MAG: sugar phosphate isomerase/epimerase [Planctomycetes bacterium]|nr:sugar phosphate isomerase/epimerase [Planctomycetota bacterium]
MNRRDVLKLLTMAAAMPCAASEPTTRQPLGLVIHSYWIRREKPLDPEYSGVADPFAFLQTAAKIGATGIQTKVNGLEGVFLAKFREATERLGMYVEGTIALPKVEADVARFESEIVSSKAAGATVLRTVCMNGRRYEQFVSADQFQQFVEQSWMSLTLAEPIAAKHRVKLAVENHKDWRVEEMLGWLQRLGSEFVGVCLDTGNSIALLEDPHAVVEALAPWTVTTHLKDMAVAESEDGFLLSEVPLGDGFLDIPRIVATLRKSRAEIRLNLEMITRDPLRVPCLLPQYWATLSDLSGRELADALTRVRHYKHPRALPKTSSLSHLEQLRAEADNIARCLTYAKTNLA